MPRGKIYSENKLIQIKSNFQTFRLISFFRQPISSFVAKPFPLASSSIRTRISDAPEQNSGRELPVRLCPLASHALRVKSRDCYAILLGEAGDSLD
jgi:hypothetical protein